MLAPGEEGVRSALHAAAATLPHLRRGLTRESAGKAIGHLHALTQAAGVMIDAGGEVLAADGLPAAGATGCRTPSGSRSCSGPDPYGHTVVAPLVVQGERIGRLAAFYGTERRLRPEDTRVVSEVACAGLARRSSCRSLAAQEERLAQAELRALRAQISPHFIYNALAAVANSIHTRPEEARELLTEFAEFTRYAFRGNRSYVTLADELHYVEKYLRLEQARFGDRLDVRVSVAPEVLTAVVPVLSMQPLVENAVRHGVESATGPCRVEILGADLDADVELTVKDGGAGMTAEEAAAALDGRGAGIGLANVHARLQSTFGPEYGLEVESAPASGTVVRMLVPKFRAARVSARGAPVTLRVLAVDDERPALDDLARVLRAQPAVTDVDTAASGEEALHALAGEHYDAVFLDVRMPGLDGVELARVLRRFASPPALIFVSAYESAAVEAFELRALDYLLKPVSRRGWPRRSRGSTSRPPTTRRTRSRSTRPAAARAWCGATTCSTCRRTATTCAWSRADGRFLVRGTLGEIERRWAPHGFHRVHRRFLVNLRSAAEVRPQLNGTALLILADGAELPIARREVAELRRRLRSMSRLPSST